MCPTSVVSTGRDSIRLTINDSPVTDYNGINIDQTRDYIKTNCREYLDKILEGHGWSKASNETIKEPLHPNAIGSIESAQAPTDARAAAALADKMGFSYRAAIGELIYAYVTCRPDIGYANGGSVVSNVRKLVWEKSAKKCLIGA